MTAAQLLDAQQKKNGVWLSAVPVERVGHRPRSVRFGQHSPGLRRILCVVLLVAVLPLASTTAAAQDQKSPADLADLSLEDLMQLEVTSVSKREERLLDAPAAISVVTQEDIRRSGVTSIPEALRLVPGVQVGHINGNVWGISARGFNSEFANKLLVLIDGRSVYTPLFSGVYWDVQDMLLEDIDRIEVIRGPGATLWGANAVNGVINILSKSARETQGALITGGGGTEERGFGGIRYGGKLGEHLYYRVYAKYFDRDGFVDARGHDTADDWDMLRGGFRLDWDVSPRDLLTLQGDLYDGNVGQRWTETMLSPPFEEVFDDDIDISGGNVLARWTRTISEDSHLGLQLYYDHTERQGRSGRQKHHTADVDLQHDFALGSRHRVVWGLGYRFITDEIGETFTFSVDPASRDIHLFSGFVQDEITLVPERLRVIVGSKFEHNDFTGFEGQPSARVLWTPHKRHTVWAAVSRAVRTPSRVQDDSLINIAVFPGARGSLNVLSLVGDRRSKSEELLAYELGYRLQPSDRLFLDIAAFYNVYNNLVSLEPNPPVFEPGLPPRLFIPQRFDNKAHGETYGVEVAANWALTSWWRLVTAYTWFDMRLHRDPSSRDTGITDQEGDSPHNQFHVRSSFNLPWHLEFDTMVYYVDNLPNHGVPSYTRLDVRLGWRPTENLELSLVGQNLSEGRHREFGSISGLQETEVERGMYGKVTWKF